MQRGNSGGIFPHKCNCNVLGIKNLKHEHSIDTVTRRLGALTNRSIHQGLSCWRSAHPKH